MRSPRTVLGPMVERAPASSSRQALIREGTSAAGSTRTERPSAPSGGGCPRARRNDKGLASVYWEDQQVSASFRVTILFASVTRSIGACLRA